MLVSVVQYSNIFIPYEMITRVSLVPSVPILSYYNIIDHTPYAVYYTPVA